MNQKDKFSTEVLNFPLGQSFESMEKKKLEPSSCIFNPKRLILKYKSDFGFFNQIK